MHLHGKTDITDLTRTKGLSQNGYGLRSRAAYNTAVQRPTKAKFKNGTLYNGNFNSRRAPPHAFAWVAPRAKILCRSDADAPRGNAAGLRARECTTSQRTKCCECHSFEAARSMLEHAQEWSKTNSAKASRSTRSSHAIQTAEFGRGSQAFHADPQESLN